MSLPLDSFNFLQSIGKREGIQTGTVAKHILTFAIEYEKAGSDRRRVMLKSMGLALPMDVSRADELPMQFEKRGKKASKTSKIADLVE